MRTKQQNPMKPITATLPEADVRRLDAEAERRSTVAIRVSRSAILRELIATLPATT